MSGNHSGVAGDTGQLLTPGKTDKKEVHMELRDLYPWQSCSTGESMGPQCLDPVSLHTVKMWLFVV